MKEEGQGEVTGRGGKRSRRLQWGRRQFCGMMSEGKLKGEVE